MRSSALFEEELWLRAGLVGGDDDAVPRIHGVLLIANDESEENNPVSRHSNDAQDFEKLQPQGTH